MVNAIITTGTKEKANELAAMNNKSKAGYEIVERINNCEFLIEISDYTKFRNSIDYCYVDHICLA